MADLAPAGAADRANLAHGERRHVVVEHELLAVLVHDAVDPLLVGGGAQHCGHQRLGLTALEDRRAMGTGQEAHFTADGPQVARTAAIRPLAVEDQLTDDPFFHGGEGRLDPQRCDGLFGGRLAGLGGRAGRDGKRSAIGGNEFLDHLVEQLFGCRVPVVLEHDLLDLAESLGVAVVEDLAERVGRRLGVLGDGQAQSLEQVELKLDDLLVEVVGTHDRVGHFGLGQLFAKAFDHDDSLVRAGDDQVQIALLEFIHGRKGNELAIDTGDPHRPDGTLEGRLGQQQRGRRADDRRHIWVILPVGRDRAGLDLHLVAIPLREEWTDRPVNQPGGEDFLGGRPALALDETAGEFAGGIGFFSVIDGQWKEIEALATRGGHGRDQRHGVANPHDHSPAGLLGQKTGLQTDHFPTNGPFNTLAS